MMVPRVVILEERLRAELAASPWSPILPWRAPLWEAWEGNDLVGMRLASLAGADRRFVQPPPRHVVRTVLVQRPPVELH